MSKDKTLLAPIALTVLPAANPHKAPSATPAADATLAAADTLDLTFAGDGATFSAGKIRVYAWMVDVSDQGDSSPVEVDRDLLA